MNSTKDNMYCIYSKGNFILEKNIYLQEHNLIQKKGFISVAVKYIGECPSIFLFINLLSYRKYQSQSKLPISKMRTLIKVGVYFSKSFIWSSYLAYDD